MIGVGCSLVFAVQIVIYVMVNLTIFPTTAVFLPLFTYGGTGTIVSYALIGILLSIYRYQNVLPQGLKGHLTPAKLSRILINKKIFD